MKKFKDFQPTAMDSKGVGSEGQEDWLVLPTSRTRDTGPLEESNFAAALERLGGESDTVQVHRFGHWGPGWFEIIVVHPSRESEAEEIEKSLENYPSLDEDDMSRRESEEAWEDWKNWGESEFKDIIKGLVELDEEQEDMLDYHVDLAALWREVSNHLGWSEQHDGHSTNFNFKEAERYLSDNTELIFDAIDAAHSSPLYLTEQKKAEDEKLDRWHKATRGHNPGTPIARWESRGGKHFAELYDNGDGTYSYRSDGAGGYMGAMSPEQAMSEMEKKIKYLAPDALKLGLMRVENPPNAKERVIFRKYPENGEVIALFPELLAYYDGNVPSYVHVCQHGAADLYYTFLKTHPASEAEYADLKAELEQIGYKLDVIDDWPTPHDLKRRGENPPTDKERVRVIFRKFADNGEVIALFPDLPFDNSGNITSYMHVGQHGAASPRLKGTHPASEAEYADLKAELEQIGYELDIIDLKRRGENPLPPNKYPLIEVNGRMFASHRDAYDFAMDRANESGEEVVIMQKDDSMLPWFMLQKIYPHSAGITGRSPLSEQRYYEEMDKSQSSNPSGENPPTAYIDFANGRFEMWENVDGDRHRLGRSENIGNLAHQIRDYGYKRVVLTAEAADRDVDRDGWCLLGQGSPGGSPGNAYGKASEYLKSSLHGVDVRPNPER